jgi:predicted Zn-dependent peptidase
LSPGRGPADHGATVTLTEGVRETTLPSGVRIVTETMPDVRSAAVGFWINCGSRDERESVAGASHFLEHLLFKGTRRRSAKQIAEAVDAVGGDINAFTSKEHTCFYARTLDRDLPLAIDVLADMIKAALNRTADVDAEREVVLEEIRMHLDTPDDLVHSVFAQSLFGSHPLGREILGDMDTITALSREQIHRYYRRQYVAPNLVVAAAGNLQHDDVVGLVSAALADWPEAAAPTNRRTAPARAVAPALSVRKRPTEQAHLVLGGRGIPRGDDRRFAAGVLNQALGGGMASRLFQEIRERRGLVYTVYSYQESHSDAGAFAVYAGTAPRKVSTVLDVVRAELERVIADGLHPDELARAKGHLAGSMVLALEDTGSRMSRLGKSVTMGVPLLSLDDTIEAIEAVNADHVKDLAQDVLGGPFTLALVGPFGARDTRGLDRYCAAVA